jgi:hypothetical protein
LKENHGLHNLDLLDPLESPHRNNLPQHLYPEQVPHRHSNNPKQQDKKRGMNPFSQDWEMPMLRDQMDFIQVREDVTRDSVQHHLYNHNNEMSLCPWKILRVIHWGV